MFLEFIEEYVQDLIECSDIDYDITEEQQKEVCYRIANNDGIWQYMDEVIYDYLGKYERGDMNEDNC